MALFMRGLCTEVVPCKVPVRDSHFNTRSAVSLYIRPPSLQALCFHFCKALEASIVWVSTLVCFLPPSSSASLLFHWVCEAVWLAPPALAADVLLSLSSFQVLPKSALPSLVPAYITHSQGASIYGCCCARLPRPTACDVTANVTESRFHQFSFCEAPNTHIGGSGVGARTIFAEIISHPLMTSFLAIVTAFYHSLLLVIGAGVVQLWLRCVPGRCSPLGRLCRGPFMFVPRSFLLPLGLAASAQPVLSWTPGTRPTRKSRVHTVHLGFFRRALLALFGFSQIPLSFGMPLADIVGSVEVSCFVQDLAFADSVPAVFASVPEPLPGAGSGTTSETQSRWVSLPDKQRHMNLSTDAWLGVTVFAPYTQPRAFGFRTTRDSSFAQLVHDIRDAELLPCPEHDCVQPLRPQPHDGYLAVVTYPSVLDQDQRRRKAVIVDLSRVGGGIYVETLPTDCTPDRLFTIIHGQMNVDPFEEAVQIWVSNRGQEAPRDEPMLHTHGDVLHVIRAEYGKPFNAPDDILFSPTAHWGRIDHMPEPPVLRSTALSCGTDIFAFDPSFFPNERPQDAALRLCRKFCRLPPQSAKVSLVDNCPPLHIEGFTCRQTFVIHDDAPDRAQLTDPAPHCHYLLDLRPLGLAPRTATTTCCAPDLPDILIAADVSVPAGLCGTLLHSRLFGDLQVLKIGVARDLATRILGDVGGVPPHSTLSRVTETSAQELNSAPDCPAGRLSDFSMPVPATRAGEPTVFPREGRCPEAHEALYLADAETTTAEAGTFRAGFHVLIPDFHAETYELPLEAPCDLDEVLHMLADTRDSDASWYFDHIIPAYPQPDPSFVCVIAVPIWAGDFRFSAVDTRAIDGRLFSFVFPERLNRSSILLHIGLPASADLRVFLGNDELETHGLYDFSLGITVTVLPPDFSFRPGLPLEVRLADRHGWAIPCPTFGGVEGPKFGLLSEGLPKLIQADTEAVTSSAFFKAAAARLCAYQLERVTVCPTVPQLQNFAFLGHHCDAVIAATESISRIPVPPGRLMIRQHVVFFDARLALQGLSWTTAPNGFLNHDEVIRRFQATMPVDYAVNIKGGHIAHKGADTLLRVDHDCLLTITFNEDFGSSILRSSPSQGPSGQAADTDSSDTDSDTSSPTGSTSATAPAAPRASPPRGSRNRSRSTRRHCPLPDNELALCSGKPDAVCVAPCPLIASMPGQWYKDVSSFCTQWFPWLETTALVGCELQPLAPLRGLKLLQEPACQTFAEEEQLRVLYEATRQLGGNWLADRRPLLPNWLLINPDPMPHLADELPDFTQWISCAVLKVGFLPEHHTILLHIPATPEEAIHAIQAVRAPDLRSAFPTLLAVLPQPCFGTAVYIAVPAWLPGLQGICIDTSQVDGRLFATTLPDYIDRWEVLRHAHMPTEVEVEVWADTAPHVLVGNDIAHVFPGELITVIRPGDDVPIPYTIGQLLLSRQVWSETSQLPVPAHGAVYGLIFKGRLFIHSEPFHNPMHYRQRIADAVGAPAATMRLFAAHSRPSDVCVHGLPCGALIAIGVPPPGPPQVWHCVILDCRYIADGWREVYVYNGRLDVSGLLQQLQGEAPLGWRVKLSIIADAAGFAYPPPGEVITVTYTLPQIDTPPSTPASEPAPPSAHGDPEETSSLAAYSDAADDAPSVHEATLPTSESLDHHAEAVPDVTVLALPASPYITCIISMPEYTDEVLRVPLEQTATLATLLESLKALRAPTYADLFPFLLCVRPQPDPRYLRFLALPAWPCEGTPVLFAVQDTSRRTFAVRTSAILRYAGAMVLASLPEDGSYQVFIGNSDEELSRFVAAPLSPGDLIVLVPTFDRPSRHAVADLLAQAATAGGPPAPSPVSTPSCIWLLTDDGSVHFPAAPRRGWSFADAVAAHIHADTSTLSTAVSSPSIRDHACCGVPSANVVLAMSSVVDTRDIPPGSVPYILDQRPVLLPIYAAWAESGIVSVLDICRRAQPRCPPDYCVRLSGGTSTPGSENHWRRVCPGEVLVVRFEPAHTHVFSTGHEAPQQHIDGVPDPPSFANNFSESDTASIDASSSSRVADAGTGGTNRDSGRSRHNQTSWAQTTICRPTSVDHGYCHSCRVFVQHLHDTMTPRCATRHQLYTCMWGALSIGVCLVFLLPYWVSDLSVLHNPPWRSGPYAPLVSRPPQPFVVVDGPDNVESTRHAHRSYQATTEAEGQTWCTLLCLLCSVGRPRPFFALLLPILFIFAAHVEATAQSADAPITDSKALDARPIPTPCRTCVFPPLPCDAESHVGSNVSAELPSDCLEFLSLGPTLLEASAEADPHSAYFEARLLIEALSEHFETDASADRMVTSVSLEHSLPLTPHQQATLRLQAHLPHQLPPEEEDWLDNDLDGVLRFQGAPLEFRTALVDLPTWHQADKPHPTRLDVYTDGSATAVASDDPCITPCS